LGTGLHRVSLIANKGGAIRREQGCSQRHEELAIFSDAPTEKVHTYAAYTGEAEDKVALWKQRTVLESGRF